MELLMNGFITTDGSFGNQAGRTYSANGRSRTTAAARKNAASAYSQAGSRTSANSAQGINNSAYALPGNFARISSIVSQEDIGYWMQDESVNNGAGMAESTVVPQGNAKDFNAAQEAYGKQAQVVSNGNGLQDAINNAGTEDKAGKQDGVLTDEELALLAEEEEGKKGNRTYGFNEDDIDYMNRLLEDMKKARERYKTSNEKNKS